MLHLRRSNRSVAGGGRRMVRGAVLALVLTVGPLGVPAITAAQPLYSNRQPLEVPQAPSLPKIRGVTGDVLDDVLLGGAFQRASEYEALQIAENYREKLEYFLRSLTQDQYNALLSDDVQRRRLVDGKTYLDTMRHYYKDQVPRARPETTSQPTIGSQGSSGANGVAVYSPSQCIGAIVNGECHGSIMPNGSQPMTCHGQMLNGQCTGPMF